MACENKINHTSAPLWVAQPQGAHKYKQRNGTSARPGVNWQSTVTFTTYKCERKTFWMLFLIGKMLKWAKFCDIYMHTDVTEHITLQSAWHARIYRPIACDVTFGHFHIRLFGCCTMLHDAGGQKCIAVIERKALNISLFTNASDYSNKTCTERSMYWYLTNMVVSLE